MKSLASIIIDQKKVETEMALLKAKVNLRGKVTKKDMEDFERIVKRAEPIFEDLKAYEGKEVYMPGGIAGLTKAYELWKQEKTEFYKNTVLCEDDVYRTPEEIKAQGIKA